MKYITAMIVSFLLLSSVVCAQETNGILTEAVGPSNQVILDIFQDILKVKKDYPELENFGEKAFFKNKNGINGILYEYTYPKTGEVFSFGITINAMDDIDFEGKEGKFNYGFSKLGVKISGFSQKHPLRTQFDLMPLVSKYGMALAEEQQNFMPLRVFIRPVKGSFQVRENVEFDVVLKNVSKRHMVVKSLGQETLYFLINKQGWGTSPLSGKQGGSDEVLKSGEETVLRLKGESFQKPQEIELTCFYRMSIDGVNPVGKIRIMITE